MEKIQQTPSQTIGPFFAYSLTAQQYGYNFDSIINENLMGDGTESEQIFITGKVFDGAGEVIHDAMIELWQADDSGNYPVEFSTIGFKGFGRSGTGTDADRAFTFKTIKPGKVNRQTPHINVMLFMRGSLHVLHSRIYFDDEENDNDPLFKIIDAGRRKSLVAKRREAEGKIFYEFNIYMQGENETVFFDI